MPRGITGCIARVEPTSNYQDFLHVVRPEWAMIKLHHAGHLVDRGETAASWAPHTKLITTSTINDELLEDLSWEEERDIVQAFRPRYHIPTDVSVYRDQSTSARVEGIENCLTGAAYMKGELAHLDTEIIPLFKGYTDSERELSLRAAESLNADRVAIYVSRYFSGNQGNNRKRLFHHLERYGKHDMPPTVLIGLLSPNYLQRVPEYVVAGSGQNQWRQRYNPTTQTPKESQAAYEALVQEVTEALNLSSQNGAKSATEPTKKAIKQ